MEAQRLSLDIINTLPPVILETILCLVPIKDAVRTSVLSKKWRYTWIKIPKLDFNEKNMFDTSSDENQLPILVGIPSERKQLTRTCKVFYAIYQVLLLHQAPVIEFALYMENVSKTNVEIDQIITHLSWLGSVKKFKLDISKTFFYNYLETYRLPLSIFLLHQLTDLYLDGCIFEFEPTFTGFSKLLSLDLVNVSSSKKTLLRLLSSCPSLKRLCLTAERYKFEIDGDDDVTIIDIFNCIPLIEHLTIYRASIQHFFDDKLPRELPTALVHLKYLCLNHMWFAHEFQSNLFGLLIRSSPNLEKIKLDIYGANCEDDTSVTLEDYSDISMEHLTELEIEQVYVYQFELEFVKFILAKSPVLKKVSIIRNRLFTKYEEEKMLRKLLLSPPASPVVEIIVERSKKR